MKQSWPSKTIFCCSSFCFGVILNRSFPLDQRTSTKYYRNPSLFQANSQRLFHTCAVTARPVYRALLPVRMLKIELYQISLSPGRGRSGFEISSIRALRNHFARALIPIRQEKKHTEIKIKTFSRKFPCNRCILA